MSKKDTTQEVEVKETNREAEEVIKETNDTPKEEAEGTENEPTPEPTVEELLQEEKPDNSVPLSTFLDVKKEKKELEKELSELKAKKEEGANKSEINSTLKDIADKYDVDPNFLGELSDIIYSKAKGDVEEKLNSTLKPLEEKERKAKIDKAFNEHFDKTMDNMPEYKEVVNKEVIKSLSLLPQNSKKTFQQIIEETYSNTVTGKKTMETSTPRGGKDASLDMDRIKDPEYFKQVMANPELKKKYNEGLVDRINL